MIEYALCARDCMCMIVYTLWLYDIVDVRASAIIVQSRLRIQKMRSESALLSTRTSPGTPGTEPQPYAPPESWLLHLHTSQVAMRWIAATDFFWLWPSKSERVAWDPWDPWDPLDAWDWQEFTAMRFLWNQLDFLMIPAACRSQINVRIGTDSSDLFWSDCSYCQHV